MKVMKMRKWYVVLIAIAVIAVAWGIGARIFLAQKSSGPSSPLASVSFAYYTNSKGQPWAIPTGASNFTVSSKETYPRFVLGSIDPTKVSIGDTQKMQIVVRDNVPLTKVWAEVENDKGIDSIPLAFGASSTVSYNTIQNQKYLVGDDGKLVINDGSNKTPAVVALIQSLFQKANAEQAVDSSYDGFWVVHNTQTITYHTTFYAMDSEGRAAKLVIAWSDPCSMSANGSLTGPCSLTSATDGTDATSTNLASYNLTLNSGGLYIVNPGYGVNINGGSITFNGGTLNTREYLYYQDNDGDGYATSSKTADASPSLSSPYIRISAYAHGSSFDCNDSNANIYQTVSVATDTDHDRYSTGPAANACVGDVTTAPWYKDASGNGTQIQASAILGTNDCNDSNASIYPGEAAWWGVNTDFDCSGAVDHGFAGPGTGFPYTSTGYTGTIVQIACFGTAGVGVDSSGSCGSIASYSGSVFVASGVGYSCAPGGYGPYRWTGSSAVVCR